MCQPPGRVNGAGGICFGSFYLENDLFCRFRVGGGHELFEHCGVETWVLLAAFPTCPGASCGDPSHSTTRVLREADSLAACLLFGHGFAF